MRYIDSTSIGGVYNALTRAAGGSLPGGSGVFSWIFGGIGARSLSKAKRKKIARRRYRMFVDNIIMHHKRLHDKNRQITIDLTRRRMFDKSKDAKREKEDRERKERNKWRDKYAKNNRAVEIKERINARRIRAKSSWTALIEEQRSRGA